jgi:hypothetical protein
MDKYYKQISLKNVMIGHGSDVTVEVEKGQDTEKLKYKDFDIKVGKKLTCTITLKSSTSSILHSDIQNDDMDCDEKPSSALRGYISPYLFVILAMLFITTR